VSPGWQVPLNKKTLTSCNYLFVSCFRYPPPLGADSLLSPPLLGCFWPGQPDLLGLPGLLSPPGLNPQMLLFVASLLLGGFMGVSIIAFMVVLLPFSL
jgi:hypothetical protein